MGSSHAPVVTLANSIVGVSVLAMPFCFKQCGVILASLMLIASAFITRTVCYFLLKSSIITRRRSYELLAYHTLGRGGKFVVEVSMIGFLLGTLVAFLVVMGDLGPQIVASVLNIENNGGLRSVVMSALALFVALPLALLRDIESLSSVSTASFLFYAVLVVKILTEGASHEYESIELWRPAGVLQCIPIIAMALSCQTQIFSIYESLPEPSLQKMNSIVGRAVNICTLFYILVGFFGYISVGGASGNILLNLTTSWSTDMIKCGFVMSIVFSFPLCVFPCRASLYSLLFRGSPHAHPLQETHMPDQTIRFLTVGIVGVTLVIGLIIPNIELVLGLVGSTAGALVCIIFPSLLFIKVTEGKATTERLVAKFLLSVGLVILCLTTYVTLYAVEKAETGHKPLDLETRHGGDLNQVELKILKATSEKGDLVKEKSNIEIPIPANKEPLPIVPQEFLESLKQQQEEQKKLIEEQKSILEQLQVHANDHKKEHQDYQKPSSLKPIVKPADEALLVPDDVNVFVETAGAKKANVKNVDKASEVLEDKNRDKVNVEPVVVKPPPSSKKPERMSHVDDNDRVRSNHAGGSAKTKHAVKVPHQVHEEVPKPKKDAKEVPVVVPEVQNNQIEGIEKLNLEAQNMNADAAQIVKELTKINLEAVKPVEVKISENQKQLPKDANIKAGDVNSVGGIGQDPVETSKKLKSDSIIPEGSRKSENLVVSKNEIDGQVQEGDAQIENLKAKPKPNEDVQSVEVSDAKVKKSLPSEPGDERVKVQVAEINHEINSKPENNHNTQRHIGQERVVGGKDKVVKIDRDM